MAAFDRKEAELLAAQAKEKWGGTQAYREFEEKGAQAQTDLAAGIDEIMAAFGDCRNGGADPASDEAQALVARLQRYLTDRCYTCTDQILAGLGQMYVADERFRTNIDRHGAGTAAFISAAVNVHCASTES